MTGRQTIVLTTAVFVLPIVLSWLYVNLGVDRRNWGLTNKGELIEPTIDLRTDQATYGLFDALALQPSDWALVLISEGACEAVCRDTQARLNTIHQVIGSQRDRLKILTLTAEVTELAEASDPDPNEAYSKSLTLNDPSAVARFRTALAERTAGVKFPQIVVVDWRRQAMLRFDTDMPSGDIKKDIKKLLSASKIR